MSLLVPPEFSQVINKYSGFISTKSPYSKKNLKGLFFSPENQRYLTNQLYSLITNPIFVAKNLPQPTEDYADYEGGGYRTGFGNPGYGGQLPAAQTKSLIDVFKNQKTFISANIQEMVEMHPLPYDEELFVSNPIMQLHGVNRDFILKSAQNIVQNPEILAPRYYSKNLETGQDESDIEWDYTSESYADGTWHPEHLFTNSKRNRDTPYWEPLEVNFYSGSEESGLGHRYYNKDALGMNKGRPNTGPYAHSERTRSQFPRWQAPGAKRQYEYDNREGLDEGGLSDRRTQRPHGYNMAALRSKSTY